MPPIFCHNCRRVASWQKTQFATVKKCSHCPARIRTVGKWHAKRGFLSIFS